jgi:threonine 3-dehydrogenase
LFSANVAKACGAAKVIGTETSAFRKKLAEQMGVDVIIDPSESGALEKILKASGEARGVDVVIEMSGHPAGIDLALHAIKPAGHFVAFGLPGGPITLDYSNLIVFKGVQMQGLTGRQIYDSWTTMDALLRSGKIDPRPVITHEFEMKDFEHAFAAMMDPERKCGKVIMIP